MWGRTRPRPPRSRARCSSGARHWPAERVALNPEANAWALAGLQTSPRLGPRQAQPPADLAAFDAGVAAFCKPRRAQPGAAGMIVSSEEFCLLREALGRTFSRIVPVVAFRN